MIKRFNRYELKYIVKADLAETLIREMRDYVTPDPEGGPSGTYQVTSLYYDTRDAQFYRAKLDGLKFRRKLRIRRYGVLDANANPAVMVEIKQRINRTTQKRRVSLPLADAELLCEARSEATWQDARDAEVANEIMYLVGGLRLLPACTVAYQRQAFVGSRYEPGLRVTFDRGLWCRDPGWGLGAGGPRYVIGSPTDVVLEVKANDAVPLWVPRLLARHDCRLTRFSKYCAGVARLRRESGSVTAPSFVAQEEGT